MKKKRASHGEGYLERKEKNGKPYGSYLIRYREGGKRCYKNLHTTDYAEAKNLWHQWAISRQNGQSNGKIAVVTWLQDFLRSREEAAFVKKSIKQATYHKDRVTITNLTRFLEGQYPGFLMKDVTTQVFEDYTIWRSKETRFHNKSKVPITKRGINKELSLLATIFKKAVKLKLIPENPVTDVQRFGVDDGPNADIAPWPVEQVRQIIQEVWPDARDAIAFVAMTGCRRAEMEHLRWRDVNFDKNIVVINGDQRTEWTPKTRNGYRDIPMSKAMRNMLLRIRKAAAKATDDDVVFPTPDGRPMYEWSDFPLRRFQDAIRRLQKRGVEIASGSLRTLRHWFISHAINRDDDPLTLLEVQRIVGHGDLSMIERVYYHPDRSKVQRKMSTFGDEFLG